MRAAALDRRVRKEARILVREARTAGARIKPVPEGLAEAAAELEAGLAAGDLARVRRGLPRLDELVEELPRTGRSVIDEYAWAIGVLVVLVLSIRMFVVEAFKIPSSSMLPTLEINDHIFVSKFIYGLHVPFTERKLLARSPARGEVIVFVQPCQKIDFIKRVVGVAGDRIEVRCNVLYVNGEAVPNALVPGETCAIYDNPGSPVTSPCSRYRETLGGHIYDTVYEPDRPRWDAAPHVPGDAGRADFPRFTALSKCAGSNQTEGAVVLTQPVDAAGPCGQQLHYVVPEGHVFVMGDYRDHSNDSRYWGSVPIDNIKGKALFFWLSYRDFSWSGVQWDRMGNFVH